ncbi:hypothetical protein A2997_00070 [Candidatus Nomurabacteria bacterium RIFCSPLOWO2_01_FULL_36_10b]|uniref:TraC-like domain-containing protein n=1 Tax=Candidatus Nomurabacteria bacterium RIFCSPLOWO2_01_FULL_36_10b TaxID=1801766 RepID=A0A1F6WQ06_9BACT|nr:MAG: hypothetical protein A2997_00070 [Candidatus Nomurabacteria bacterium RIFCSPLOWO2_01_FULL_36_10b]
MANETHSQNFVAIKEIRDGVVILKSGALRGVLLVTAMNLALKSSEEQEAVIYQFQNFLNSIDFSIEIVVQSRRMDIRPYLQMLDERLLQQKEELMRVQTKMYIEYIRYFSEEVDIMKKYFFVVVPYTSSQTSYRKKSIIDRIFGKKGGDKKKKDVDLSMSEEQFQEKRLQLEERIGVIRQGLQGLGLKVEYVDTPALVDLFYSLYNPGDVQKSVVGSESIET